MDEERNSAASEFAREMGKLDVTDTTPNSNFCRNTSSGQARAGLHTSWQHVDASDW